MSVTFRHYKVEDLGHLAPIRESDGIGNLHQIYKTLETYKVNGPAFSLIADGVVISIFGGAFLWPGVVEIWALTTELVHKYPKAFHSTVKGILSIYPKILKVHRIQCTVHTDNKRAAKWIERLGFEKEGVYKMYGADKSDFIRYAKICHL